MPLEDEVPGEQDGGYQHQRDAEGGIAVQPFAPDTARHDHDHAHQPEDRPGHGARADDLAQQQPREIKRDQRRDEADGDGFGKRQVDERGEEAPAHEGDDRAAHQMDAEHAAPREDPCAPPPDRRQQHAAHQAAQQEGAVGPDRQRAALHYGVHRREQRDSQRCRQYRADRVVLRAHAGRAYYGQARRSRRFILVQAAHVDKGPNNC